MFSNYLSHKIADMEVYLVGGAVRDTVLGRPVKERDWVVLDSSPEEMLQLGYRPVGKQFPVFLHPETHEEYALARTERKVGKGHGGFDFQTGSDVTLEDDLLRRDLTINAIAMDDKGELIDPYGGLEDIKNRVLRHVSQAFGEDPLRIFRVARFACQLPDFSVSSDTLKLMEQIAVNGELLELSAERVWSEFSKALLAERPEQFLTTLRTVKALAFWFPEFSEVSCSIPGGLITAESRYASLGWELSPSQAIAVSSRLRVPKRFSKEIFNIASYGRMLSEWRKNQAWKVVEALEVARVFHDIEKGYSLIDIVGACSREDLHTLKQLVIDIKNGDLIPDFSSDLKGQELGKAIRSERIKRVEAKQN